MQIGLKSGMLSLEVEHADMDINELCGFACRQNPKRGFLFVSKVLGKHYPVKPHKMSLIYQTLAQKIAAVTDMGNTPLFLGFAETATGLSAGVYQAWKNNSTQNSYYIHTTRYHFSDKKVMFNFQEEHSHATGHIVYHPDGNNFQLANHDTLVLIDDEMTTGKTMTNFIEQFLKLEKCQVKKIIMVCIKNWMSKTSMQYFYDKFPQLEIEFVHLLKGVYEFKKDEHFVCDDMPNVDGNNLPKNHLISKNHGRFGLEHFPTYEFKEVLTKLDLQKKTLVLGTGEFSYQPFLLAQHLENQGVDVVYQSTTRSPIMVGNDISSKMLFLDNYGDNIANFVYNVSDKQYEQIIICYETKGTTEFNLDKQLQATNVFFEEMEVAQ